MTPAFRRLLPVAVVLVLLAACSKPAGDGGPLTGDMSLGDPNAKVKVVEYASATCHFCADFNRDVFPTLKAKYVDTGQVHYTFREILTPPNNVAAAAFLVARCAGREKYFDVLDATFQAQPELLAPGGEPRDVLRRIAVSAGLSEEGFQACITDEKGLLALNARVEAATREGDVAGTPTLTVNGKKLTGSNTLPALEAAIAEARK